MRHHCSGACRACSHGRWHALRAPSTAATWPLLAFDVIDHRYVLLNLNDVLVFVVRWGCLSSVSLVRRTRRSIYMQRWPMHVRSPLRTMKRLARSYEIIWLAIVDVRLCMGPRVACQLPALPNCSNTFEFVERADAPRDLLARLYKALEKSRPAPMIHALRLFLSGPSHANLRISM